MGVKRLTVFTALGLGIIGLIILRWRYLLQRRPRRGGLDSATAASCG
jgi:hypothetical protein